MAALKPFHTSGAISYSNHSANSFVGGEEEGVLLVAMHGSNRKTSQLRRFLVTHLIHLCRRKTLLGLRIVIAPVRQPAASPSSLPPQHSHVHMGSRSMGV